MQAPPGIDWTTIADVEEHGVALLLDELATDLAEHRYRPLPARRVWIPKPGATEQRPLSIPAVRDRIVQAALKTVIEPIFEADFRPTSFGFRPKRSAHDALQVLIDEAWRGRRWVVETDIASCFESIPHDRLMQTIEERICDRQVLKLLRAMLRAGVMDAGAAPLCGHRHPTRRRGVPAALQRLSGPARPGVDDQGRGTDRPLRRRSGGDVRDAPRGRALPSGCSPTSWLISVLR